MKERVTAGKIWGVIYPYLIHRGVSGVIVYILMFMVIFKNYYNQIAEQNINLDDATEISMEVAQQINSVGMHITLLAAIITIPIIIFFMKRDVSKAKQDMTYKKYERVNFLKYIIVVPFSIFVMLSANYLVSFLSILMPASMTDTYTQTAQVIYGSSLLVQVLAAGICAPIVEELIYRGLVYNRLKRLTGLMPAAIISSIIFGIIHGNFIQAPYAFIIGMAAVFVYEKYKSIFAPILLHISANMFSIILTELGSRTGADEQSVTIGYEALFPLFIMMCITGVLGYLILNIIKRKVNPKEI